nr:iron-containing alcohol dehydrogenase [uncultured Prevotella sp.]
MLGNFSYQNSTKLYFGEDSLKNLSEELKCSGHTILFNYGGGSIKRNGIYDQIMEILQQTGKKVIENPGVMSNPTLDKLLEGIQTARKNKVDFILSVGGGSVCDYSKAVAASVYYDGDPWKKFFLDQQNPAQDQKIIPVGVVLTMAGTGSEMNTGSVITDAKNKFKVGHMFDNRLVPRFSILNPRFTFTVPENQMKSGIFDIMSHIMEQYFSGEDDNTSDYIAEGLMRGLIHASKIAVRNPEDYESRSNIMWTATWALNSLIGCAKKQDWEVHMIGHSVGAQTHAPHGFTLAAVSLPYYHLVMKYGLPKFKRFAENVWNVNPTQKTDQQIAEEGLDALKNWMVEIGLPLSIKDFGATEDSIAGIVKGTIISYAVYCLKKKKELILILKESLSGKYAK